MTMQSHLHNDGVGESAAGGALPPERKEEEEAWPADDGDGGVGVVGWGEARI